MHWNGDWHMGGMGLWWILIIAAFVAVVWFAMAGSWRGGESRESPEQTLKRRYANGEIDRETHERMLSDLRR